MCASRHAHRNVVQVYVLGLGKENRSSLALKNSQVGEYV